MARYSEELKCNIQLRMIPPHNESVSQIARDSGLSEGTLYKWQKEARANGAVVPGGGAEPEKWSSRDKFSIVLETATLSEVELAEYCRAKGLYAEQIEAWRDACMQANGGLAQQASQLQKELRTKEREMKTLTRELKRKEAALAETAALLVLRKRHSRSGGTKRTHDQCLRSTNGHGTDPRSSRCWSQRRGGMPRDRINAADLAAVAQRGRTARGSTAACGKACPIPQAK